MRSVWIHTMGVLFGTLSSGTLLAQSADPPLTFSGALDRALTQQPALAQFAFELRAQESRIAEAALRPPTTAEILVEDAAGSGERDGLSSAQTTLSLSQLLELGGKRASRVAAVEAERARLKTTQAARQLDLVAEVARRFIDTLHAQAQIENAEEGVRDAERTQAAVIRRVREARSPAVEAARAEVRRAQARLDLEHAQHGWMSSRQFLAAAMGEREVRFGRAAGNLLELTANVPFEELASRLEATPDFLRFADETRVRDAQLRLAELRRRPDVTAQFGVRRFEAEDEFALIAGISVPLNSARRARSAIDVARADRERLDSERETAFLKVRAQLFAQYQELEHARLEARVLQDNILPQLVDALEKSEFAYQRGRYSYLEWTDAQRELLSARRRLSEVAAEFHTLRVEIERLTGESLGTIGARP